MVQIFGGSLLTFSNVYTEGGDFFWPRFRIRGVRTSGLVPSDVSGFARDIALNQIRLHDTTAVLPYSLEITSPIGGSGTTYVFTTAASHGFAMGDSVTLYGFGHPEYNSTFPITAVTGTTFTVTIASTPTRGGALGRVVGPLHLSTTPTNTQSLATYTTTVPHSLKAGQQVLIQGIVGGSYNSPTNVNLTVHSVTGTNSFTCVLPTTTPGTATSVTSATIRGIDPMFGDVDQCFGLTCILPRISGISEPTPDHPYFRLGPNCFGATIVLGPDVTEGLSTWNGDPTVLCAGAGLNGNVLVYWDPGDTSGTPWKVVGSQPNEALFLFSLGGSSNQTVTPDCSRGSHFLIQSNGTGAITVASPSNPVPGRVITLDVKNTRLSGSITVNSITWPTKNGNWPSSAITFGKRRTITLYYDGSGWIEVSRVDTDM
jgi:hypothetical protein